jgi:hypothetical protein
VEAEAAEAAAMDILLREIDQGIFGIIPKCPARKRNFLST